MVIRIMEMLFEYMSFVLCIHKIAKRKIDLNIWLVLPFFMEVLYVACSNVTKIPIECKLVIFCGIFLYVKMKITMHWKETVNICGTVFLIIMLLQVFQFYLIKFLTKELLIAQYEGISVNITICLLIFLWKEKYGAAIMDKLNEVKGAVIVIIFLLILARILHLFSRNSYADFEIAMQFLFETVGVSIACILWMGAENEKNHKEREVQMYETYNHAFEETIMTIRARQHEFENHINAINCMRYTVTDYEKLLIAQEQYCEKVLRENKLNALLKLDIEPVVIGFLYSKITLAEEKGITVNYEIQSVNIGEKIAIYEFVELIGILFDNAVDALEEKECKKIIIKLQSEDNNSISLEIANTSRRYLNSEIEKFCSYGYSTKGEKRGVGLSRVTEIAQKNNTMCQIENCIYDEENYLSFKMLFS